MSTEIVHCSIEGPKPAKVDLIADDAAKAKKRWVGVKLECCKENPDSPFRKLYVDLFTGWGASGKDPRTLHSYQDAIEALNAEQVTHIVYLPDENDDHEQIAEMNRKLCPVEMEVISQPTYSEVKDVEPIRWSYTEMAKDMSPIGFLGRVAWSAFELDRARTLLMFDIPAMTRLLNEYELNTEVRHSEEWVEEKLQAAFDDTNSIILADIEGENVRFTRESAVRFDGPGDVIVYAVERLIKLRP